MSNGCGVGDWEDAQERGEIDPADDFLLLPTKTT